MTKYIVYGQKFDHETDDSLLGIGRVVKIRTCDTEAEAYEELASVRKSDSYEYEWIREVEA